MENPLIMEYTCSIILLNNSALYSIIVHRYGSRSIIRFGILESTVYILLYQGQKVLLKVFGMGDRRQRHQIRCQFATELKNLSGW